MAHPERMRDLPADFACLFLPRSLPTLVQRRRALLILSRVRLVAVVFSVLTPLWIPVDLAVFDARLGTAFALLRTVAATVFGGLLVACPSSSSMAAAHRALAALLAVPTAFFLVSQPLLAGVVLTSPWQQVVAAGYAFLPFVMVAGLSVFPITALEGGLLSGSLLLATLTVALLGYRVLPFESHLGAFWLLTLLCVVATLAGMSQLHFMTQLVRQASHDGLTQAYTRRAGEEMLDLQFDQARRAQAPLTLAFLDLDDFKAINDGFGHEDGDDVLRQAAQAMRRSLRRIDLLIRWGGEEFVIVMPNTDVEGARVALARLREAGLGRRPDGTPQTASIGVAERCQDQCVTWMALVETADRRMYQAKQAGKNRTMLAAGEMMG